ncbi:MAG: AAA family ATPase [Actinomycetales bacterium]
MNELIEALSRAVQAAPDDLALRRHLASVLLGAGQRDQAVTHLAAVLAAAPGDAEAAALMGQALGLGASPRPDQTPAPGHPQSGPPSDDPARPEPTWPPATHPTQPTKPTQPEPGEASQDAGAEQVGPHHRPSGDFDWHAAESQVGDIAEPMFVDDDGPDPSQPAWDVERASIRLADVGGMVEVKQRLEAAFLAPLRNPELRRMYGKSLRGGLLLYGPPGCGKTFVARAVAGEMGAKFISVGLSDILDMWIGSSEKNLHELFALARREAPVVLFLDELDALGIKRSQTRNAGTRGTVNQLLSELDGVDSANEGVFVLAATNQPWDIDPALRRPGRLDRTLLVLPPDEPARAAILRHHLSSRPVSGVNLPRLAKMTDGYSGADLAHLCDTASERAMMDSVRTGQPRMIGMDDLTAGLREVRPSIGGWFDAARNVVTFADPDGSYADLRAYMKKTKRL